jgi:hypothetical protein
MATINYKGNEIESISECKVFDEPHNMLVWNRSYNGPIEKLVCAVIPYRSSGSVITTNGAYEYCAEIPEKSAPRIATNRELAKWLAQGKGEWCNCIGDNQRAAIEWWYDQGYSEKAAKNVFVRKWSDTEWHAPDVEYMGIADVTTF